MLFFLAECGEPVQIHRTRIHILEAGDHDSSEAIAGSLQERYHVDSREFHRLHVSKRQSSKQRAKSIMIKWLRGLVGWLWGRGAVAQRPVTIEPRVVPIPRLIPGMAPTPLTWSECHPTTVKRFKAEIICSYGHAVTLRNHRVDRDGFVSPSVVCREPLCRFHEFVRLEGWTAGPVS